MKIRSNFGMLHSENLTPHRAIWTLAAISAVVGCISVAMLFGDGPALYRRHHQGAAAGLLLQLRLSVARRDGGHAEQPADGHAGVELRHVPALRAQLRDLHGGVPQPRDVQPGQAPVHPALRAARQSGLHGVLSDRTVHGIRHQDGTAARTRESPLSGASTAEFTSCRPARRKAGRRWWERRAGAPPRH